MIFESHAHYDDARFDEDRKALLESLKTAGISHVVNVGANMQSSNTTLELAKKYPFIYAALGIHPEDSEEVTTANLEKLRMLCRENHISQGGKVVAVGEIGLDYYWDEPNRKIQKRGFEKQLELAKEVKLPVIIHSREAAQDTVEIMQACGADQTGGVVHCYSYSGEMAKVFLNMGFYIGLGGVVTFSNARKIKEAVAYIPIERILVETDSPYLAPMPNRGKRNSSLNLPYIIEEIAAIKGMSSKEVEDITAANAKQLFGKGDIWQL